MGPVGCQGVVRVIGIVCVMGGSACYGGLASDVMGELFLQLLTPLLSARLLHKLQWNPPGQPAPANAQCVGKHQWKEQSWGVPCI